MKLKRVFDIVFACLILILAAPLWVAIIFALKLSGSSVFYRQKRVGKGEKLFMIWKFETMRDMAGVVDCDVTLVADPRVTKVGAFLRKTKLNELPQLINVLNGEMSFVGPRPVTEKIFSYYSNSVKMVISRMTPGITGIGSIFFRDEEKYFNDPNTSQEVIYRSVIAPFKGSLEVWYEQHRNFVVDLVLIASTFLALFVPVRVLMQKLFPDLPNREITQ